jgi:hypothetical protein
VVYLAATELTLRLPANVSIGTNTSPLSLGEVGSIIGEVSAQFDSVAARAGYTVPIAQSATLSMPLIQQIVRDGAGARVLRILFWGTDSAPLTTAEEWEASYKEALRLISDADMLLPGAGEEAGESGRMLPRSFSTSYAGIATSLETGASVYVPRTWEP